WLAGPWLGSHRQHHSLGVITQLNHFLTSSCRRCPPRAAVVPLPPPAADRSRPATAISPPRPDCPAAVRISAPLSVQVRVPVPAAAPRRSGCPSPSTTPTRPCRTPATIKSLDLSAVLAERRFGRRR